MWDLGSGSSVSLDHLNLDIKGPLVTCSWHPKYNLVAFGGFVELCPIMVYGNLLNEAEQKLVAAQALWIEKPDIFAFYNLSLNELWNITCLSLLNRMAIPTLHHFSSSEYPLSLRFYFGIDSRFPSSARTQCLDCLHLHFLIESELIPFQLRFLSFLFLSLSFAWRSWLFFPGSCPIFPPLIFSPCEGNLLQFVCSKLDFSNYFFPSKGTF